MADIIKPDALNERFTVYLNAEGKPLQHTLREMTADEVLRALKWQRDEADRLEAAAKPFMDENDDMPLPGEMSDQELMAWAQRKQEEADLLMQNAEAQARCARLMLTVGSVVPATETNAPLVDALRRYWPGGRHAA